MLEQDLIISQAKANLDAIPMVFAMTLDLADYHHLHERINRMVRSTMQMTNSELGLLYLLKGNKLELGTMLVEDSLYNLEYHKFLYQKLAVPVNEQSLAGAAALQGKIILLENVHDIPSWVKAVYNPFHEKIHGINSHSILCVPLLDEFQKVLGVLQLANGKNSLFFAQQGSWLEVLQSAMTQALAQGIHEHCAMMRTLGMVQLHDPRETLGHVSRMGAMAAEIYQALHPGENADQIAKYRDYVRVATMYHDLGKVAVSAEILQKDGPLDLREFMHMQSHTIKGAGLFAHEDSEMARMCLEVIFNHHEHWDGTGYPGSLDATGMLGPGKRGDEIPQSARIALLADVYDHMTRIDGGTEPWPEDEVLAHIRQGSGRRFDPQVVEAFFQVYDTIQVIKDFYSEH